MCFRATIKSAIFQTLLKVNACFKAPPEVIPSVISNSAVSTTTLWSLTVFAGLPVDPLILEYFFVHTMSFFFLSSDRLAKRGSSLWSLPEPSFTSNKNFKGVHVTVSTPHASSESWALVQVTCLRVIIKFNIDSDSLRQAINCHVMHDIGNFRQISTLVWYKSSCPCETPVFPSQESVYNSCLYPPSITP